MKTIRIDDGLSLSQIALGDCRRGLPEREAGAFDVMDAYYEHGGRTFDSARAYEDGASDRAFGKWLRARGIAREGVQLITKGSFWDRQTRAPRLSAAEIERDLVESLSFAGLSYSDLHLLHRDDVSRPVSDIVPPLSALVQKGLTRAVGVSNWTVSRIIQANVFALENGFAPIRASQVLFSLAQTSPAATGDLTHVIMDDIEMPFYRESQLPVMCFGAHARGWFAARLRGEAPKASPAQYYDDFPQNRRRLIRLEKLAGRRGVPTAAVLTAYVRDHGLNAVVLSSFSGVRQLEEAFVAETFTLTPDEIKYLQTGAGTCQTQESTT